MKNFITKLFQFSLGPVIGAFIGFITIPLVTHFISPDAYGKVSMFNLVQSILSITVYLGMDQAYVRAYNQEEDKRKVLFNALLIPLIVSLFTVCLVLINPREISLFLFGSDKYTLPVYLLIITIPLMIVERFLLLNIRMAEKALAYSFFNIFLKLLVFMFTFIFIFFVRKDFLSVVYSSIIGQIIGDLCLIIIYRKYMDISLKLIDKKMMKEMLKFGLPLMPAAIIGLLLNSVDRIGLRSWSSFEEIGLYSAANKIVNILGIVQTSFTSFWVPIAYRWYNEKKDNKYYSLVSEVLALIMTLMFLGILLFKNILIYILSSEYSQAQYIMPFLLFFPIMYTMSETTTLGIPFSKKTYLNLIISIVSLGVNSVLNFILIPKYGACGAAFATGISYIVFFWTRTLISRSIWYKFPLGKFIFYTVLLVIMSSLNIIIKNNIIHLLNILSIVAVLVCNIPLFNRALIFYKESKSLKVTE